MSIIFLLQWVVKPLFGQFSREEFKKFLRMGLIFALIIGSFWTIGTLRNALFITFVGAAHMPYAKTISLLFLIPVIVCYTKLVDLYRREKIFYILATGFGSATFVFGLLFAYAVTHINSLFTSFSFCLGYTFFLFVESYGLLMVSLFWAIASDITLPESAKKGFSLVVAIGQLGGIFIPYFINSLPRRLGLGTSALSLYIAAAIMIALLFLLRDFFKKTPGELLVSYKGANEQIEEEKEKEEAGFLEGLWLLMTHSYLLGISAVILFPEIISTIFDVHFNSLAAQHYSGVHLVEYLGLYGSSVNIMAFIFLVCGIGNVTRLLGVGFALLLMPIIYGMAVFGFITLDSLNFLFFLMASSKAINYALNGPAIKQLYIPTTHNVRFKSQAWIESFGSRGAKGLGSVFNMLLGPLQRNLGEVMGRARHAVIASYFGFMIVFVWFFIALFLGRKYKKAIDEKNVVC